MLDADPEDQEVRAARVLVSVRFLFKTDPPLLFSRKETYTFFKEPLDALYALGEPKSSAIKL